MLIGLLLQAVQRTSPSTTFGTDPTEPLTRVEIFLDHSDLRSGAMRTSLSTRFDYAILDRFVLRADAPLALFDARGSEAETGIGDVRAQFGWRAYDDRSFAMFFGGGVVLDTGAERGVGQGSDRVVAMVAAAGALPEIRSRLTETIEHFVSYDRDEDARAVALTKLDIELMTEWSPRIWTRGGTEMFFDWKHGDRVGMNLDFEVGRASASGFALYLGPSVGLFGTDVDGVVDWKFTVGARWLF